MEKTPLMLGLNAAAVYTGLGRDHIRRLEKQGILPSVRVGPKGGRIMVRTSDLDKLVNNIFENGDAGEAA